MASAILTVFALILGTFLPHLPGRYDASATTISFVCQVASFASLLLVPVGVAWIVWPYRAQVWRRITWILACLVASMMVVTAIADNQLALGVIFGLVSVALLRSWRLRIWDDQPPSKGRADPGALFLLGAPILFVSLITAALPFASAWSRERVIRHSAPLIAEIEAYRQRRGEYPMSLHSLNWDVPTGVVGVERFLYERSGEAYNLFFIRPSVAPDAHEVVIFNPRDEPRFTSHELDILQYEGEQLDLRRGDRRREALAQSRWVSIVFD